MNELKFQIVNGMVLQGLIGSLRVGDCNDLIDLKETTQSLCIVAMLEAEQCT